MASWGFGNDFKEDNSGNEFTKTEREFLRFLLYQYGSTYFAENMLDTEGDCKWEENLQRKLGEKNKSIYNFEKVSRRLIHYIEGVLEERSSFDWQDVSRILCEELK